MNAPAYTHQQVIAAEVATEIMNRACAIVMARIYETGNREEADRLRARHGALRDIQRTVRVKDPETVAAVTAYWGPLVQDEAAFWSAIHGQ